MTCPTTGSLSPDLSVVIPCFNEGAHLAASLGVVAARLAELGLVYELVVVDDGSSDNTWSVLREAAAADSRVRALRLSRRFGKELALTAGLDHAKGRAVIVMDADLQHPPALIPEMVRAWREDGFEVVEAVKRRRGAESLLARSEAHVFQGVFRRLTGFDLDGATDFKLLDRRVLDAWARMGESSVFFRGMAAWLGFRRKAIPIDVADRAGGRSGWTRLSRLRLGLRGLTAFSTAPLHLITFAGLVFLVLAGVLGVQTLYMKFAGKATEGFTTVILLVLIVGSMLMIGLGIIGLYIARIYEEVKQRPRYLLASDTAAERG